MSIEALSRVPGLAAARGLQLSGGSEERYQRILRSFARAYGEPLSALEVQGSDALGAALHSLRGAASTVGADDLADQAFQLERSKGALSQDELQAGTSALQATLTRLVGYLNDALPPT